MYTPIYTEETANYAIARYQELREVDVPDKDNRNVIATVIRELQSKFNLAVSDKSVRAKLIGAGVYVKDTDAEKAKAAPTPKVAKARGETKAQKASRFVEAFGAGDANDIARLKVDTLDALLAKLGK